MGQEVRPPQKGEGTGCRSKKTCRGKGLRIFKSNTVFHQIEARAAIFSKGWFGGPWLQGGGASIWIKRLGQIQIPKAPEFFPEIHVKQSDIWRQKFGRITCQNLRWPCFRLAKMRADSRKIPSVIIFQCKRQPHHLCVNRRITAHLTTLMQFLQRNG